MSLHTSSRSTALPTVPIARVIACSLGLLAGLGCAPTVNVLGVYFPGWLVSATLGIIVAYTVVRWLAGRPRTRTLGQSGLLFCSLTVAVGLLLWWIFFSGF